MEEDEGYNMIEEKEELMIPPNNGSLPTLRKAYFLKPILNPNNNNQSSFPPFLPPKQPLHSSNIQFTHKRRIYIRGMLRPLNRWKSWVDNLQQTHEKIWKKVGIFDAIKASTYHIIQDNDLIIGLAKKWCFETNTFVFPWGECTVTLEDVMILGGFPVMGNCAKIQTGIIEDEDVLNRLIESRRVIQNYKQPGHCTQKKWLNYFMGKGDDELEHVALLVLWLSRYVFTSYSFILSSVFSIAISLARGTKVAFAPAVLALIYRDLGLLKRKIISMVEGKDDGSKLYLYGPLQIVQVWAWERFPGLSPKPGSLACGEPRVARWHEIKRLMTENWGVEIDESAVDDFLWRPYGLVLRNWEFPSFYCDHEKWVLVDSEDEQLVEFAKCLMTCELVGIECVEGYFPQRVALQFGLDQDIPLMDARLSDVSEPDGLKFYLPPRLSEGDVSLRYSKWWKTLMFRSDHDCERKFCEISRPFCSSYQEDGLDSVAKNIEMPNEISAYCEANAVGEDTVMNLQGVAEDTGECEDNVMEDGPETRMNCGNGNMFEGSKIVASQNNEHVATGIGSLSLSNSGTGLDGDTENCADNAVKENEGEEREEAKLKQFLCSVCNPVTISMDEDSSSIVEAFEARCCELGARMSRLERIVSALKANKV